MATIRQKKNGLTEEEKERIRIAGLIIKSDSWKEVKQKKSFIYVMKCEQYHKIGYSYRPEHRLSSIKTSSPFEVELVLKMAVPEEKVTEIESLLHGRFSHKRKKGEWFSLEDVDLEDIKSFIYDQTN